jgi:hypothetical protein
LPVNRKGTTVVNSEAQQQFSSQSVQFSYWSVIEEYGRSISISISTEETPVLG